MASGSVLAWIGNGLAIPARIKMGRSSSLIPKSRQAFGAE
jgi:hypothetical protein